MVVSDNQGEGGRREGFPLEMGERERGKGRRRGRARGRGREGKFNTFNFSDQYPTIKEREEEGDKLGGTRKS
jgi:hypothetical protein